jgi:hypothetical protein
MDTGFLCNKYAVLEKTIRRGPVLAKLDTYLKRNTKTYLLSACSGK